MTPGPFDESLGPEWKTSNMILPHRRVLSLSLLGLLFMLGASAHPAIGQQAQSQPNAPAQPKAVPLPHLYWHFLIHQNDLDNMAAQFQAKGRNGNPLRNDLQTRLGFSDSDYAPIRTSSQRLASELKPLDAQLKALPRTAANVGQTQAVITQRETYINNEIYNLSLELSPQNKAALENFMAQFFAPKQLTFQSPAAAQNPAGMAVKQ
jgi:hypothetical protein